MIDNLGNHRLPPALMAAVSPESAAEITERNRATPKRKAKGSSPQYAENKRYQDRLKGLVAPVEYHESVYAALEAAGIPL